MTRRMIWFAFWTMLSIMAWAALIMFSYNAGYDAGVNWK